MERWPPKRGRTRRSVPTGWMRWPMDDRPRTRSRRCSPPMRVARTVRSASWMPAGGVATFTGSKCMDWAGGVTGTTYAVQGNILVGPQVPQIDGVGVRRGGGDLCDRLLSALLAGDAAGGDRRGRQSAALLVVREGGGYEGRTDRYIDLRVDDHPEAPAELARLFGVWDDVMLVRNDPLLPVTPELVADLQAAPGGARPTRAGGADRLDGRRHPRRPRDVGGRDQPRGQAPRRRSAVGAAGP